MTEDQMEYETAGIQEAWCRICDYRTQDHGTMDLWNGYGECPNHEGREQHSVWTKFDGTVVTVRVAEDGTHTHEEEAAATATFTTGPVTCDGELVVVGVYPDNDRWNGWLCPSFDALSVVQILEHVDAAYKVAGEEDYGYDWSFDDDGTLVLIDRMDARERTIHGEEYDPERYEPDTDGLYPLGAWGWCWYAPEEDDATDTERN